jgi:hypothetical protein
MQAVGLGPPVLNLKALSPGRAEAYPAQDMFQSLLQQRMVSRNAASSSGTLNRSSLKTQLRQARPTTSTSSPLTTRQNSSRSSKRSAYERVSDPKPWDSRSKASNQTSTTKDQGSTQSSSGLKDTSSASWRANLRSKASRLARGNTQVAAAAAAPNTEMPPVLKGLIEFLQQQPGQALKVPPDRVQDVQAFLLKAGISQEQVENLLNSPSFQEQGLTAQNVQAAWQNDVQNSLQQTLADSGGQVKGASAQDSGQLTSLKDLTSQPDYQQLWQNLILPAKALGDLRVQLQQMGVPPDSLNNLNEQNYPQGISLTEVWQLLQQAPKSPLATSAAATDPTKGNTAPPSPLLISGANDVEKWRQLLVQAGMDPELAQTLVSGPAPANREELRTTLVQMAPPSNSPQDLEIPKPLYLPENVRVRQVPWLQQGNLGQGQGSANGNLGQNLGSASKLPEVNLPGTQDLNNFLALLTGGAPENSNTGLTPGATGATGQSVNALLTPEAREALWAQVQSGVLGNLKPGENQITLTLNPPDMGKLHLTLNLKGENVEVTAITTHPAVAEAATAGVQQLALALNQQGLVLTQCQFHLQDEAPGQPQLAFNQDSGDQRQTGRQEPDRWEQPATPRRRRWAGGIDCFA